MSVPSDKNSSVPRSVRDVNHIVSINGESTAFHYKGKMFQIPSKDHHKEAIKFAFLASLLSTSPFPWYGISTALSQKGKNCG